MNRFFISILLLPIVATGCASDQSTLASAAQANTQLQPAVITDPDVNNYFQQIGERIIQAAKESDANGFGPSSHTKTDSSWMFTGNIKFHLVNSKTVNAFTTGGEHVYIYNAAYQMCKNEDELAAVMSHEFAHIYCRHVQQGTNSKYLQYGAAGLAAAAGYVTSDSDNAMNNAQTYGTTALAAANFLGMGYTRSQESQADEIGFHFYSKAGWDPDAFSQFFQAMIDAGYDTTSTLQSDHPMLKDRVTASKKWATDWKAKNGTQSRKPEIADQSKFAQIKQKAAQVAASSPDDTSLKQAQALLASFSSCVAPVDNQPEQVKVKQNLEKAKAKQQQQ